MRNKKTAYFAGGCFWCITPTYAEMEGVDRVLCGYCGGEEADPTYEDVKKQKTKHRETICITYDPEKVSYDELLEIFINSVDPFDEGGQFIDRGYSYTLAIYYEEDREKASAESQIKALEEEYQRTAFISVEKLKTFYTAEEYHQNYYKKNPEAFERELIESGRWHKVNLVRSEPQ